MAYAEKSFHSIQIGAFRNFNNAVNQVNYFNRLDHDAFYRSEMIKGKGKWYGVFIDRYRSKHEAEKEAIRLKQCGLILDYLIRTLPDDIQKKDIQQKGSSLSKTKESKSNHQPKQPPKKPVEVTEKTDLPLVIKDIAIKLEKGRETVSIYSNRFFKPSVFALKGKRPRSVIDIKNINNFRKDLSKIVANGEMIKQIRTHLHKESKKLRIVLDLYASKNYQVSQIYYEDKNIYTLEIKAEKKIEIKEATNTEMRSSKTQEEKSLTLTVEKMNGKISTSPKPVFSPEKTPVEIPKSEEELFKMEKTPVRIASTEERFAMEESTPTPLVEPNTGISVKKSKKFVRKGSGRNLPQRNFAVEVKHSYIELEPAITNRKRITSNGTKSTTQNIPLESIGNRDFSTSFHIDTIRTRFGVTDYLEIFADIGSAYHDFSDPKLVYGGGARLNLFELKDDRLRGLYGALQGEYMDGGVEYKYKSHDGIEWRKKTDWQDLTIKMELGLVRSRLTVYVGEVYFRYFEDTERKQLDGLPVSFNSVVLLDELEEKNGYSTYGGIAYQLLPSVILNIEGQIFNKKSLFGSFEFHF